MDLRPVILALFALLAAGCLGAADVPVETAAAPPAPLALDGRVWLPPNDGEERKETAIAIPGARAGDALRADLALGSAYVVEVPAFLTDVMVELRDASGAVLAEGHLTADETEAALEAIVGVDGEASLVLLSYGGSDGRSSGDHVDYAIALR